MVVPGPGRLRPRAAAAGRDGAGDRRCVETFAASAPWSGTRSAARSDMIARVFRSPMPDVAVRLRRFFQGLRAEGAGPLRETAAVALGVFIGCLPLYGLHLAICWIVGCLLGLNRLKMYFAANVSNPFVAPWLVFAEVQVGAWVRRGSFHPMTREYIASTGLAVFGIDALVGSVFVGA